MPLNSKGWKASSSSADDSTTSTAAATAAGAGAEAAALGATLTGRFSATAGAAAAFEAVEAGAGAGAATGAATEAALSLREGGELLQPQELYAELIRERVLSAALQVQIDAMEERHRVQLATERSAALRLVEERTQATEARYRKELEAAQRRGRLLGQRQKEQQQVVH